MLRFAFILLLAAVLAPAAPGAERAPVPLSLTAPATPQAADLLEECTIVVLSGKATADGRPLLWKNRDSGYINNELAYFHDGRYPYITVINAGDSLNAWMGVNETGFAVLNALSYNLADSTSGGITNGQLMKLALQTCATVDDFEKLLLQTAAAGRENPANLAVIDAVGGAAIFEVGSHYHWRFDALGADGAGAGYLVRANFSLSADTTGVGTWRFRRASKLMGQMPRGSVRRADLFRISRDLCSAYCDPYPLPFTGTPPGFPDAPGFVDTRETIQRTSTVSSGLIQGVRPGENPRLSTFFVALGKPAVTPFVPAWVAGGDTPPELDGPYTAPFCDLARARALECHDHPGAPWLINTYKLSLLNGTSRYGLFPLGGLESKAHDRVDSLLAVWRARGVFPGEMAAQEESLSAWMYAGYASHAPTGGGPSITWQVTPTPMRHQVRIVAAPEDPAAAEPERIEIFDLAGRRVAGLARHPGTAGLVSAGFAWDGRDESGRPVPAGLYFGRSPGASAAARILVVR
jgi:hypothetical protein